VARLYAHVEDLQSSTHVLLLTWGRKLLAWGEDDTVENLAALGVTSNADIHTRW
jgi:hypothetical protein